MKKIRKIEKKEIQPRLAKLLKEVKDICEEHGLRYYLWGGTLLGAIRHNGFIPWDDDIDICMPREDYNKLIELQKQKKLKNTLHCHELEKNYKYLYAKYCEDGTLVSEKYSNAGKFGLFVDIFPLDGLGNDRKEIKKLFAKLKPCHNLYWASIASNSIRPLLLIPPFTPLFFMWRYFFKKLSKATNKYSFDESTYVGKIGTVLVDREILEKDYYTSNSTVTFEGEKYSAPNNPHKWLEWIYGKTYMTPPPEHKRKPHGFKAWETEIKR